jgi:hypothetical protein
MDIYMCMGIGDSSVIIETRLWAGSNDESFLFATVSRQALGPTQPLIQEIAGILSLGLKQMGHEADHSPPSSAEVPLPIHLMAWCLIKQRIHLYGTVFS